LIEVAERLCVLNGKLCGWLEKSGHEIEPNVVYRGEKIITAVRECGNVLDVQSNGSRRVVTPLEFLQHALSKLGHHKTPPKRDDPLYASKLRGSSAAKRLRSTPVNNN
jgi:hypothetical protein